MGHGRSRYDRVGGDRSSGCERFEHQGVGNVLVPIRRRYPQASAYGQGFSMAEKMPTVGSCGCVPSLTLLSSSCGPTEMGDPASSAQQAALRRVAMMVAGTTSPEEVFATVAEEVGQVLAADLASMVRYESRTSAEVVATWATAGRDVTIPEMKAAEKSQPKNPAAVRMRRHVVHRRSSPAREKITRPVSESIASAPSVVRTTPEQPHPEQGLSYESFWRWFGKGKQ